MDMELGNSIRQRRTALGFTLEVLAEHSGVSRAMLSDIERGVKNPTIKVVAQIAEGLGCSVSELIGEQTTREVMVVRRDEHQVLLDPQTGVTRQLLSPAFVQRGLEVVQYMIPAGATTGTFPAHRPGVAEHITVLEGVLYAQLGAQAVSLATGDSVSFRADLAHEFSNPGTDACHYLLIVDSRTLIKQ